MVCVLLLKGRLGRREQARLDSTICVPGYHKGCSNGPHLVQCEGFGEAVFHAEPGFCSTAAGISTLTVWSAPSCFAT